MLDFACSAAPEAAPAAEPLSTSRDARGRFRPGVSGNPAGKRPGTRHLKTILEGAITGEEGHKAARVVIEAAIEGDKVSARWLIGRIDGAPKGRFIEFAVEDNGDMTAGLDAAFRGVMDGTVTLAEAWDLMRWVQAYRNTVPPRRWMDSPLRAAEDGDAAVGTPGPQADADAAAEIGIAAPAPGGRAAAAPALGLATPRPAGRSAAIAAADAATASGPGGPAKHLHFAGGGGAEAVPPPIGNRAMRRRAAALARAAA